MSKILGKETAIPILRVRLEVTKKIKKKTQHKYYDDRILSVVDGVGYSIVRLRSPSLDEPLLDLRFHTAVQHNTFLKKETRPELICTEKQRCHSRVVNDTFITLVA